MTEPHEKALEAAIEDSARAEGWDGIITGMMVLISTVNTGDRSGIAVLYPAGDMSWPMSLGMLRAATLYTEHRFNGSGDDD